MLTSRLYVGLSISQPTSLDYTSIEYVIMNFCSYIPVA